MEHNGYNHSWNTVVQSIANFLLVHFPKYITETRKKLSLGRRCLFECGVYLLVSTTLQGETLVKEKVLVGM